MDITINIVVGAHNFYLSEDCEVYKMFVLNNYLSYMYHTNMVNVKKLQRCVSYRKIKFLSY